MWRKSVMAFATAFLTAVPAQAAAPKLFEDSEIVTHDRFSDEIVGQGADLVFIPGLSASRETWKATAERLKSRYRVHLIQIAGFAGEDARANASGPILAPAAEAIDAYLVAQHLTPATIIGHSLGGTMALYLAEHRPGHLKRIILIDTLPFYSVLFAGPQATVAAMAPMAEQMRRMTAATPLSDRQVAAMATEPAARKRIQAWSAASTPSSVGNAMADAMSLDLRPGLSDIHLPVTLIYPDYAPAGRAGGSTANLYSAQYAALKGITFTEIKNAVHFVMLDQPAAFAEALDAALEQKAP